MSRASRELEFLSPELRSETPSCASRVDPVCNALIRLDEHSFIPSVTRSRTRCTPLWLCLALGAGLGIPAAHAGASEPLRELVSAGDLHYAGAMPRSEEGLPIGNGRMGSLVWTTPTSIRLQINRVDVQPINAATTSFHERNSDYMGGCGFVDVEFGGTDEVFSAENSPQHLSIFEGGLTIAGHGIGVRMVALPDLDVFALEIDDRRRPALPLVINLRMLRHAGHYAGGQHEKFTQEHIAVVRTHQHTAASQLHVRDDRILLTQDFREGMHVAKSAVGVAVAGRKVTARVANETTVSLAVAAADASTIGAEKTLVLIGSAAALGDHKDIAAVALRALDAARGKSFRTLAAETAAWWRRFWERGTIALHSADGVADLVAAHYHYYLYLMAATSRGKFPPKFNGMLWNTAGDLRTWGAQHWFANLSCYYEALLASNRLELLDPMFAMYSGMADAAALAARQQWGSEGIFIPETVWFDGLAPLPDDIAAEMRDLYLVRKPWEARSARFMAFAATRHPHSSRWNWWGGGSHTDGRWVPTERGNGPFGNVTHILGTTAKVAYLFWRRYEYTLDREWLRTRAYPMLRGAAEFYRHFPNLRRDERGVFHVHHTNSNESVQDVRDSDEDLSAMRGVLAAAIRAAELLQIDAALRRHWREVLEHLAPLPTSDNADAVKPADYSGPPVFVRGRTPVRAGRGFTPDGNSLPQWFFDLCNLGAPADRLAVANATFDRALRGQPPNANTPVGVLSKLAIAGVALGRVDATRHLIPNQIRSLAAERESAYRGGRPLANRLSLREGHQAFDVQRIGRAAEALQLALLNSAPSQPTAEPILRLFAAWPPEWNARFTLRARGGFVVSAAQQSGEVEYVEIVSEAGALLRLQNPWGAATVQVERNGTRERASGALLELPTRPGERIRLAR